MVCSFILIIEMIAIAGEDVYFMRDFEVVTIVFNLGLE